MNPLKEKYYLAEIFKTRLGNSHGTIIKAKPVFLLAVLRCIANGHLADNQIELDDTILQDTYRDLYQQLQPGRSVSPFILPYFHLAQESYYNIKWTGKPFVPSPHGHSPSWKYLRANSEFAYLEKGLWDILQERESRDNIYQEVIDYFFRNC